MTQVDTPGHEKWLETMTEARENCREKLAAAMVEVSNPERAVWPRGKSRSPERRHAMHAHVSVIDYADMLTPYRDEAGEAWTEKLDTDRIEGFEPIAVSLDVLDEWESATIEITETAEDELHGTERVVKRRRLLLPVQSGRRCYRQLNQIVRDLGFAAEIPVKDYDKVDPI